MFTALINRIALKTPPKVKTCNCLVAAIILELSRDWCRVLAMKVPIHGGLVALLLLLQSPAAATTCVAERVFKVAHVCGTVLDSTGVPIPKVEVELLDMHSAVLQRTLTDDSGRFRFPDVTKGKYVVRVKYSGFADAWQPFIVTKKSAGAPCKKPMQVRLDVAGRCSSISKPR